MNWECMKRIFVIDRILTLVFIVSAISGFGLHIVGHGNSPEIRCNWTMFHVLGSVLFFVAVMFHVATHRVWFSGIIKNGIGRKSKVTVVLSFIFLLLSVTGLVLLGINETDSLLGLWHYKIGIIMIVIAVGHIIKRRSAFRKS